ncbi:unnamed protein product [Parascedosporium putredinis]|uniref:Uncharacterized protein n=1 Tax=Parascedosporium putredinis TaxID=1442378 RepID=A0A9P1H278_9PEZI|nr:unnamed protein product [Parascedosporium putredinis]CAI7994669.1 unnamed protein product [Parascedosporium putredinis]
MVYWAKFPVLAVVTVRAPPTVWGGRRDVHGWRCPADPDDLHVLMQRYFSSRVGLDRVPGEREDAAFCDLLARAAAKSKAARFSQLLRSSSGADPSASEVVALRALLPDKLPPFESQRGSPATNFEPVELYDNPAWWIYAAIGQVLLDDEDLKAHGPAIGARYYAANGFVLPPAPIMSVAVWPPEGGGAARAERGQERGSIRFALVFGGLPTQPRSPAMINRGVQLRLGDQNKSHPRKYSVKSLGKTVELL